jgi:DNA (cytosine-5)-methyltransferase 1
MGYHRAGFEVVGVDINPQPNFPFEFHQADALTFSLDGFDAIHASPPCQAYTSMSNRWRGNGGVADSHPLLIADIRERLEATGVPWVIENVVGAKRELRSPILLHGGMFGLSVVRPRLFESNVLLLAAEGASVEKPVGVYGRMDGRRLWTRADGTILRAAKTLEEGSSAMGIGWMEWRELAESIPPAYTEFLGRQLIRYVFNEEEESA